MGVQGVRWIRVALNWQMILQDILFAVYLTTRRNLEDQRCRLNRRENIECYIEQVKAVPQYTYGGAGRERMYSSYSFTISALDGVEWSASRPGRALLPGKLSPVPVGQEVGWVPEPVWTQRLEEKSSCLCRGSNLDRPVVQSVVRHYTD
jgi:hypothetical protein